MYAIDVADQRIFFSVDTPCYGGDPSRSPPCASIAPQTRPSYTIASVTPGTYFVLAYRNDVNVGAGDSPGVYSRYVIECIQRQETGSTAAPSCSSSDHSLVPVTVGAGETVRRVDVTDWYYGPPSARPSYPPRPR